MDNVCHTLVGAACGEAGLKRWTRFGQATLMVSANAPDIDVLAFLTTVPAVSFRRGVTHGILAQALLPLVVAFVMFSVDRLRPQPGAARGARWWPLVLLSYVGVLSHVGLDFLNNYGIRLLMPFSGRWFYGDTLFIVDPWLWLMLGIGVALARRSGRARVASTALICSATYVLAMTLSAYAAREIVRHEWTMQQGSRPAGLMVGPVLANPFRKAVIADAGDRYKTWTFSWMTPGLRTDERVVLKNVAASTLDAAGRDPNTRAFLTWARFPYFEVEDFEGGTRLVVGDMRFGQFIVATSDIVRPSGWVPPR